jgi:hypothetical protein
MSQTAVKRLYLMVVGSMPQYQIPFATGLESKGIGISTKRRNYGEDYRNRRRFL